MKCQFNKSFAAASLLSAALLSAGFILPHCGGFALIAFVPLLWMDYLADRSAVRHFFLWYYCTFVLFNLFTTFWVCNATFVGGIVASLVNALLMSAVWALFRLSKHRFKGPLPYIFLAAAWIAWEKFYFTTDVSWPWLTLGNAFARSTSCVQWYEVTGLLGGSLWIWACNLSLFGLLRALYYGGWGTLTRFGRIAAAALTALIFIFPLAASWVRYATYREVSDEGTITSCALQPCLDPYEKYEQLTQEQQNAILCRQIDSVVAPSEGVYDPSSSRGILFVAPECFSNDVVLNDIMKSPTICTLKKAIADCPGVNILFGASSYEYVFSDTAPSYTARQIRPGQWYENHNSAFMIDRSPRIELYHKSRLVVGTEKLPWPAITGKIENMLGGNLIGHCTGQDEVSLLGYVDSLGTTPIGCAVCYESIYSEYFASYVASGARAMAVITNDAWWGNTPGYRQHLHFSALRAIETRRDIVRSANTGISAFINQRGDIVSRTCWWQRTHLCGTLHLNTHITPFVRYGDITGRLCTFVFLLLAALLLVRLLSGARPRSGS